jgi:tight adherence protein B
LEETRIALAQAELDWLPVPAWLALRVAAAVAAALLAYAGFRLWVLAVLAGLATFHLAGLGLELRRRQAEARRQRGLLDAIRFGASVMARAGNASQMLAALAEDGPFETRRLFAEMLEAGQAETGEASVTTAVERVRRRLADPLIDDLTLALVLHWRRGGKLVPALEALVSDWEESLRLQREAKAMRAGVEASVLLLAILPFVFLLTLQLLAPALLDPLRTTAGELLIGAAVGWMMLGYRILQRMAQPPHEERVSAVEAAA